MTPEEFYLKLPDGHRDTVRGLVECLKNQGGVVYGVGSLVSGVSTSGDPDIDLLVDTRYIFCEEKSFGEELDSASALLDSVHKSGIILEDTAYDLVEELRNRRECTPSDSKNIASNIVQEYLKNSGVKMNEIVTTYYFDLKDYMGSMFSAEAKSKLPRMKKILCEDHHWNQLEGMLEGCYRLHIGFCEVEPFTVKDEEPRVML